MCRVLRLPFWQGLRKGLCRNNSTACIKHCLSCLSTRQTRRCNGMVWLRNSFWSYNRSFLGGLIIDQFEWRLLFSATVPIMVVAAFMASIFMPGRDPDTKPVSLNVISFILIITSIMLFLNGISSGQQNGWDTDSVFIMLFGAIVALIIFLFRELKSKSPLLQLRLFRYRNYEASALIAFIFGAGMFGSLYIIPFLFKLFRGSRLSRRV